MRRSAGDSGNLQYFKDSRICLIRVRADVQIVPGLLAYSQDPDGHWAVGVLLYSGSGGV